MKKIILIGGGGHALSLLEMIEDNSIFAGYVDLLSNTNMPIPYIGNDEEMLKTYPPSEYEVHHALVYAEYKVVSFKAASSVITKQSMIGEGSAIFHGAIINNSTIGNNCIINTGAVIEHNSVLGNNVFVGPNATVCGNVKIGDNVLVGAGSVIREDVSICSNVVIGLGSVVVKDIVMPGVYYGIPVKFVKEL